MIEVQSIPRKGRDKYDVIPCSNSDCSYEADCELWDEWEGALLYLCHSCLTLLRGELKRVFKEIEKERLEMRGDEGRRVYEI